MAEMENTVVEGTTTGTETDNNGTRSLEEVLAELEQVKKDRDRFKSANDNLSKENAEAKRKARERMSEDERRAEEEAQKQAEYEKTIAELNHLKATKHYESIVDGKSIDNLIDAVDGKDHEAIAKIIKACTSKAINDYKVAEMKSGEEVNHGSGTSMTKEQILSIKDPVERQSMIAQNIELFY